MSGVQLQRPQVDGPGPGRLPAEGLDGVGGGAGQIRRLAAKGGDDQQVPAVPVGRQHLQQAQGGRVGPLQVVEEEGQRIQTGGQRGDERTEGEVKPALRFDRSQRRDRGSAPQQGLELRNHLVHDAGVAAQGLPQARAPGVLERAGLAQQAAHQPPEGLDHRPVRDVALQLRELAPDEARADPGEPTEVVHQGGLADPGAAAHQDDAAAAGRGALERGQQPGGLLLPPVQPLGGERGGHPIAPAELETGDAPLALPQALPVGQIRQQGFGGLVPLFRALGQKLEHQIGEDPGERRVDAHGGHRGPGQVGVDDLARVGRGERRRPGQHLVEGRSQRVDVRPVVHHADRSVQSARARCKGACPPARPARPSARRPTRWWRRRSPPGSRPCRRPSPRR